MLPALLLAALAAGPAVTPCQPSAATLQNTAFCTVQGSHVELHTQWRLPAAAAAPLHLRVAGVLAFPLDGCGNHTSTVDTVKITIAGLPCPIVTPGVYDLDLSVTLPSFVPRGTYQIQLDGSPLLCAQAQVPV